uniref:DUF1618 domain-containing protein n=1 Tax=Leersia perrieri TaxID=77586 RepID=A0A0D9WHI4_9ORYZ
MTRALGKGKYFSLGRIFSRKITFRMNVQFLSPNCGERKDMYVKCIESSLIWIEDKKEFAEDTSRSISIPGHRDLYDKATCTNICSGNIITMFSLDQLIRKNSTLTSVRVVPVSAPFVAVHVNRKAYCDLPKFLEDMKQILVRSLSTAAAARPPWALLQLSKADRSGAGAAPGASLHADYPPCVSHLTFAVGFINPDFPVGPDPDMFRTVSTDVRATSGDGLVLARFYDSRNYIPTVGRRGGDPIREWSISGIDRDPEMTRFVCNPLSGEMYRLPDLDGTKKTVRYLHLGLLTQPGDGGQGPPGRYAVAQLGMNGDDPEGEGEGCPMRRFLSESGEWEKLVVGMPSLVSAARRRVHTDQEVVAFGDRLWWVDVSFGAVSVDPFSDRPELRFVELPKGSVLPDLDAVVMLREMGKFRRMGVSEGKLRYVEVSNGKQFMGNSSWTLEHEVAFGPIWKEERHASVPLNGMPRVGAIDPLNANIVYLIVGDQLLSIDLVKGRATDSSRLDRATADCPLLPCVLPPWLESSQIPEGTHWSKKAKEKRAALSFSDMSLRRLLGLSGEVSGRLFRSYSTEASRPAWALIADVVRLDDQRPPERRATFCLAEPPRVSKLSVPLHYLLAPATPSTSGSVACRTEVCAAESGGLLLVRAVFDIAQLPTHVQFPIPIPNPKVDNTWPPLPGLKSTTEVARAICNPLSGQLLRLPDASDNGRNFPGFLTQSSRGDGAPPDRYAVADVRGKDCILHRFLSETGRWDAVGSVSSLSVRRQILVDQSVVAFGGKMWWIDLAWGAIGVDPFADKPDVRYAVLPSGSVLPADPASIEMRRGKVGLRRYRRIGVSEGRMRYVEVSAAKPYMLSSFVLDDEGSGWMLEHRVALGRLWSEPLQIGAIDPLDAKVTYLMVGVDGKHVIGVDMEKGMVIASFQLDEPTIGLTPFLLPPWLASSRIPACIMHLRRLLGLSGEVSGRLRRSHSTAAASLPAWAMMADVQVDEQAVHAFFRLTDPPFVSKFFLPLHFLVPPAILSTGKNFFCRRTICPASSSGFLLFRTVHDLIEAPAAHVGFPPKSILKVGTWPPLPGLNSHKEIVYAVCNPLTGQVLRLPEDPAAEAAGKSNIPRRNMPGFLTQSDRGDGAPPDRFSVAEVRGNDCILHRFLSGTGRWDAVASLRSPSVTRKVVIDQPVVTFGGRMWWVDLAWGAIGVDPFADDPDVRYVLLPNGSVLPPDAASIEMRLVEEEEGLRRYRIIGVSEGRLRYVEMSMAEPFVLSSFVLDDEGSRWSLEHRMELGHLAEHLKIGAIDPLNAKVMYLLVGDDGKDGIGVDMEKGMVIASFQHDEPTGLRLTPLLLPPWLASSRIPDTVDARTPWGYPLILARCSN